ncbi:uncharacterized protein LOC132699793 isoform X2 [Cylas formicarius]|uniref:uncharacterized protein LOC132699793 isoform X2 n=1 Tax=Cylas formicarius TaxID=197179 RepID=UPI0029589019|nr:uncharacterized protein LOC132699793 isoform X2 [Cylas formicarius]
MYEKINVDLIRNSGIRIVDLRSDTISRPTPEMREAMYRAEVGDDVYVEDATVNALEKRCAELLGKEEAMFVVSGTMANLIAVMVHCNQRGSELISGDKGHTFKFEQGGTAHIAGVHTSIIKNNDDGTFSLDELRVKIRKNPDMHEPVTSLIIVENTHNLCGGKVVPLEWLEKVSNVAAEHNIPVHMDGARMMNAAVYLKLPPSRLVRDVDTVCFCLSKGLGCPIGAMLAGSSSFIEKARRVRKALGGGWRQAGVLAAPGLVALDSMVDRLQVDHIHALKIAKAIAELNSPVFRVDVSGVHTNIVIVHLDTLRVDPSDFKRRLMTVDDSDPVKVAVKCSQRDDWVRLVTYWEVTDDDVDHAIEKIRYVVGQF